jgi:hypothetical protein
LATRGELADVADRLPAYAAPRRPRFWPLRLRRPRGLSALPERYRLQLMLLTAGCLPGAAPEVVVAAADELADRTRARIPSRLLGAHFEALDPWFRDHAESIAADADLVAARWAV